MPTNTTNRQISRGLDFLIRSQKSDGSFLSLSSPSPDNFKKSLAYRSVFPSALILSCLKNLNQNPKVNQIETNLVSFLMKQKSEYWSFNYWARQSEEAKKMPYPDDLDDTFCALSALYSHDPRLINGSAMAKIVTILTMTEEKEGGPYHTWIVPENSDKVWKDVDLAVNSNIAYFLYQNNVSLPHIQELIEKHIAANKYSSPYYPSIYPVIYFISRFYQGVKVEKIRSFILSYQDKDKKWGNPLYTALALLSLINLNTPVNALEKSFQYLLQNQQSDGSWEATAFCFDPAIGRKKYYAGSPALSTAFCLAAISLYTSKKYQKTAPQKKAKTPTFATISKEEKEIEQQIITLSRKRFFLLGKDLRRQALLFLKKIIKKDAKKEIVLLPYFFQRSLGKNAEKIPKQIIIDLCKANLCGWMAYTIYDDIMDNEGSADFLPVANVCLREATILLSNILPSSADWQIFLRKHIDLMESANCWESLHCRLGSNRNLVPYYKNLAYLAERSIGHALGPAAILFYLGRESSSPEVKSLMNFFNHYLIARQLNDDAHDWEKDLQRGQINSVSQILLKKNKKEMNIKNSAELQKEFWRKVAPKVCVLILRHTKSASQNLDSNNLIIEKEILKNLVASIENSTKNTLKEQQQTMEFLKSY